MDRKDDRELLRKTGFADDEVNQLSKLRRYHKEKEMRQAAVVHRRLEFIRWLVTTGKLTDQLV